MARPATVSDLLRRRAAVATDTVALVVGTGDDAVGDRLTFGEWERRSNAAARGLRSAGVALGDRVALLFDPAGWLDLAVSYLSVLKIGGVAVPVGPRFPARDLHRILGDSRPVLVVSPPELGAAVDACPHVSLEDLETGPDGSPIESPVGAGDQAEVLYPVGAMARPIAQNLTHGELTATPTSITVPPGGTFVHAFPVGTGAGQEALRMPLRDGGVVVAATGFEPGRFEALVAEHRPAGCGVTPALARVLLDARASGGGTLASVRRLVLSGPSAEPELAARLEREYPGLEVTQGPGATLPVALSLPEDAELAPLAAAQEGMVWHEQFTPGAFNLSPPVRRYRGPLEVDALEAALAEIIRRHAALRTTFSIHAGGGVQVFSPYCGFHLPVVDLSDVPAGEQQQSVARIVAEARAQPFDLTVGPLFAPTLIRLGVHDHVMVIRAHHSVYDDWSVALFRRELSTLYTAFVAGDPSPLPELRASVPEVARDQATALRGARGDTERTFWSRELDGAPLSVQLPIDDPGRPIGSPHTPPPPMSLHLEPELEATLRELARHHRATLFMALLAGFGVLVQRHTGQDDLLVSTLAANRAGTAEQDLIGCFGKKVLVRLRLAGDPTFPELLTRTRRALMGALGHQGLAYETVVQEMLGPSATAHGLSPQVALKFQAAIVPAAGLKLSGLTTGPVDLPQLAGPPGHFLSGSGDGGGKLESFGWGAGLHRGAFLGISVVEAGDGLRLVTEGVFHAPEVERLLGQFRALLADVAASPDRRISELVLATPPTGHAHGGHDALRGDQLAVELDGEAVAVTFADERLTFSQLEAATASMAVALRTAGVTRETPVGVHLQPGLDLAVAVAGIWRAGGAVVGLDPGDPGPRIAAVLEDSGSVLVVTEALVPSSLPTIGPRPDPGSAADGMATEDAGLAYVFYGSGSSPAESGEELEGVELEHGSLAAVTAALRANVGAPAGRRLRFVAPAVATDAAFVRGLLALSAGHTLHLVPGTAGTQPEAIVRLVAEGTVDVVDCTAVELDVLLQAGLQAGLDRRDPDAPAPVLLVDAGGSVSPEQWEAWRAIRNGRVHVHYGPPECSFGATSGPVLPTMSRPTVGHPLPGVGTAVRDAAGRPVPARVPGELSVGGRGVARGYRNRPELTAERFGPDPADPAGRRRLFSTGQPAARLADGNIELHPPAEDLVDLRGFGVEPARMERALTGCPGVRDVAVVPRGTPDARFLVAYVAALEGEPTPTLRGLRKWLWSRLPGYAWPAALVAVDSIPRRRDGRPDPTALPAVDGPRPEGGHPPEVSLVAAAWADAIGVERVGPSANYWQSFAFLAALSEAHAAGAPVRPPLVLRNRTPEMLGTDLAARQVVDRRT